MAENLVVNGVTYNGVESVSMTNTDGEQVQYYPDAVRYAEQTLTDAQKEQARTNIDAASTVEVGELSDKIAKYSTMTLGYGIDGKLYIFVDGVPVGNGIEIAVNGDATCVIDENNNLIISGAPNGTYTMKYQYEDGTFSDSISVVVGDIPEPEVIVNLIPTLTDIDLTTIYNDVGYKEDVRVSVSSISTSNPSGEKTQANTTLLGIMPLGDDGDVLHLRGAQFYDKEDVYDYDGLIWYYDASGTLLNTGTIATTTMGLVGTDANGDNTFTLTHSKMSLIEGTAYIRFNINNPTGELIMTRNQLIPVE